MHLALTSLTRERHFVSQKKVRHRQTKQPAQNHQGGGRQTRDSDWFSPEPTALIRLNRKSSTAGKEMGRKPEQNLQNRNEITQYKKCSDSIKLREIEYKLLPDARIIYLSSWQMPKSLTIYIAHELILRKYPLKGNRRAYTSITKISLLDPAILFLHIY